jgi:hypothetical protein
MVAIVKMTTMMMTTMTAPLPMLVYASLLVVIITKAVGSTSNAINDCVNCNASGGSDHDIMLLSCTNKSLQPSASDASSFIGPRCNLEHNTHLKVNRYDVGEDSSDGKMSGPVPMKVY